MSVHARIVVGGERIICVHFENFPEISSEKCKSLALAFVFVAEKFLVAEIVFGKVWKDFRDGRRDDRTNWKWKKGKV